MSINHKIVFLGNSAVGKTAIINQYMYESTSADHQPTIGIDFFAKTLTREGKTIRLQLWDTAGQEKFNSLIPNYIRDSTIAVFVYDITSRSSFDALEKWYNMVMDMANPNIVLVGNKCDLEEQREVTTEEGKKYAESKQAKFIETSAIAPTNIQELFEMISAMPTGQEEAAAESQEAQKTETTQPKQVVDLTQNQQPQNNGGGCGC